MANFGTADDEQELKKIRDSLLSGGRRSEPSVAHASASSAIAAPPVSQAPEVQEQQRPQMAEAAPVVSDTSSDRPAVSEAHAPAAAPAAPPRPSFTSVRPRNLPHPAATVVDAGPADVDDIDEDDPDVWESQFEVAEPHTPAVAGPAALDQLGQLIPGVSVEQLRQVLEQNPQLLDQVANPNERVAASPPEVALDSARVDTGNSLARADLATLGWRAWLVRLGIPVRKGAAERLADVMDSASQVIRCELDGPLVIGVTSYRGSCGKTSTTVLLSKLLAEIRGENVTALDADLHGTLMSRASVAAHESTQGKATMSTLADSLRSGGVDIGRKVWDGGEGFSFVPGSRTHKANTVTADEYRMVVEAVRQVAPIVLVDMSAVNDTELYQAALESLDGLVMMSPTTEDGVHTLYETQADLQQRGVGHLNQHRVTVLNNMIPTRTPVDTGEFARGLKHRDNRDVTEIPYDRHLAQSKLIETAQLPPTTKTAFTLTLAALMDTFNAEN